jgi:hypothetical protein
MSNYNYREFPLHMDGPLFDAFRDVLPPCSKALDESVLDLASGNQIRLSSFWKKGALVLEFGSGT